MDGNPLQLAAHSMWLGFWVPGVIPAQISRIHASIRKQVLQGAGHDGRSRHGRQALDMRSAIAEAMAKMDHPKGSGLFRTGDLKKSVTSNGDCTVFILFAGGISHSGRRNSFASTAVLGAATLVGGTSLAMGPCIYPRYLGARFTERRKHEDTILFGYAYFVSSESERSTTDHDWLLLKVHSPAGTLVGLSLNGESRWNAPPRLSPEACLSERGFPNAKRQKSISHSRCVVPLQTQQYQLVGSEHESQCEAPPTGTDLTANTRRETARMCINQ